MISTWRRGRREGRKEGKEIRKGFVITVSSLRWMGVGDLGMR